MKNLLVDTSLKVLTISLLEDEKEIYTYHEPVEKNLSVYFLPKVKEVLEKANIKPNDIDKIFISVGPGSFTGIRIGVTFAKTLAWTLNKIIIPYSSLELIGTTDIDTDYIVPLIDARRGYVYGSILDKKLDVYKEESYTKLSDLLLSIPKNKTITYVSYDEIEGIKTENPKIKIEKLIKKYKNSPGENPHKINPRYLKKTEAEEKIKND